MLFTPNIHLFKDILAYSTHEYPRKHPLGFNFSCVSH